MKSFLTRNILLLSLVSLFTDVASEMLYPVMPVYLKQIGFSMLLIGALEGVAEATAGLSKGVFGKWSDNAGKRLPFVQWGYFMSAVSKPMMALFTFPLWIFSARTLDRLGKGMRSGARDALLSDEAGKENKGKVFGFHRGMDTLGAAIGPLLALVYLHFHPEDYKTLFFIAFVPGLLGVLLTVVVKEHTAVPAPAKPKQSMLNYFSYWKEANATYKSTVSGLLLFTLFNSSDVFLLLLLKYKGYADESVLTVYIFYNLCYALLAYPAGWLGDKWGLKNNLITGLLIFAGVYGMVMAADTMWQVYILFFFYAAYAALTEGCSKALLSNLCEKKDTATALGFYSSFNSLALMLASFIAGFIWHNYGPSLTFVVTSAGALVAAVYLMRQKV
ncbi:MAG TPA: MFS transporter [Bacteroidia bacterium]|nr:MFS transporter [Bacteroidia bacterium]